MNDFNEQQEKRLRIKSNLEKFAWWHSKLTNEKLINTLDHRVSEYLLITEEQNHQQYEESIGYYNRRKYEKSNK